MARSRVTDVYLSHRFALCALGYDESVDEWFSASVVFSDIFDGDIWIGAAHKADVRTLASYLIEATVVDVWMYTPAGRARCVTAAFDEVFSLPLDLDACSAEVAWEWVRLRGTDIRKVRDVPAEEQPPELRRLFDQRRG